ncbi:MAG TPA: ABC transporter ATP-binding protein [Ohtaekwangia sp.]
MTFLKVSGVRKQVDQNFTLRDIKLSQNKLQKIAVAGETGSGKSTLLKTIAGMSQPDKGEVQFENKPVYDKVEKLIGGHPGIAYLSQHFELPKFLRVEQVLSYANTLPQQDATRLYKICQIDHLLSRKTDQLSGGEKQRIAMARLLISSPRLLLLDEPFSHLDLVHKNTLKAVIDDLGAKLKITCVLVSHDPDDTLAWADKIIVLKDGKIVQQGSPEKLYREPANEYAAGLFGKYNLINTKKAPVAYKKLAGKPGRKAILVRPEYLQVTSKGRNTLAGKVTHISFFGSHREAVVELPEMSLTVRTNRAVKTGDAVHISCSKKDLHFV